MLKTFLDSGVLITAWRGNTISAVRALILLSDPQCEFDSSPFVQLELLPKPQFFKLQTEVAFYERYFAGVQWRASDCEQIVAEGLKLGKQFGLSALDSLHIAAALLAEAAEFVTAERPTSPFSRVTGLKITVTTQPRQRNGAKGMEKCPLSLWFLFLWPHSFAWAE